jgi:superfamily II DNA/RNA helicase
MGIDIKMMQMRNVLPESVRIAYAHGQMNDRELEDIMLAFVNRQYDVLICTTIIESGLDIPNVNTIVVEDADQAIGQLVEAVGTVGGVGAAGGARGRHHNVAEIRFVARAESRLGHVQRKRGQVGAIALDRHGLSGHRLPSPNARESRFAPLL